MGDKVSMSIISRADARRLLDDANFRIAVFGEEHGWETTVQGREWLARIAGGFTPCSGPRRHRGDCSGASGCIQAQHQGQQLTLPLEGTAA